MSNHLDYEINKELGECYLFMGELDKAEDYYKKAASSNDVHPEPYLGLATIAIHRGNLDEAFQLYWKASRLDDNDKSRAGMGLVRMEQGANDEAFENFARALEYNPENMIAVSGLVQVGYMENRLEEVLPFLTTALELDASKDAVRFSLAGCLISLGRETEAAGHLETLLEKDPMNEGARELYARIQP